MEALDNFHHLWIYAATTAALSGLASSRLRPLAAERAEAMKAAEGPKPGFDLSPATGLAAQTIGVVEQSA